MARQTDGSLLHYPGTQRCNGHVILSTSHTHTHTPDCWQTKRRALDFSERIKEAEKHVEMHWVDLQNCKELNKRCEHTDSIASGFITVEYIFCGGSL